MELDDLFPEVLKFVRHAGSVGHLEVFGQRFGDAAFGVDIVRNGLASERNRPVISHYLAFIDGYGGCSGSEVYEGDAVFHFFGTEDGLGHNLRKEILPCNGYVEVVHYHINVLQGSFPADEDLEVAFEDVADHPDDVPFHLLEAVFGRETLGYGSVKDFILLIIDWVGIQGELLQALHFLLGDAASVPLDPALCRLLIDIVARKAHYHLTDLLDVQFVFRLFEGSGQRSLHLHRITDITIVDAVGRGLLVVNDLYVLSVYPGHGEGQFRRSQVD